MLISVSIRGKIKADVMKCDFVSQQHKQDTHIHRQTEKSEEKRRKEKSSYLRGRQRSCSLPDHQWPGRGSFSWSSASPAQQQASSHYGVWRPPCWWLPWHSWPCKGYEGMNHWQTIKVERTRSTLHWKEESKKKGQIKQKRWTRVTAHNTLSHLCHYPNVSLATKIHTLSHLPLLVSGRVDLVLFVLR